MALCSCVNENFSRSRILLCLTISRPLNWIHSANVFLLTLPVWCIYNLVWYWMTLILSMLSICGIFFHNYFNGFFNFADCNVMQPGATTRKTASQVERQNSEISYYADDEDANRKKYTRRGQLAFVIIELLYLFLFYCCFLFINPVWRMTNKAFNLVS